MRVDSKLWLAAGLAALATLALALPGLALGGSSVPPPTVDDNPPETVFTKGPKGKLKSNRASFSFISDEAGSSFECKLDSLGFRACTSPVKLKHLAPRGHTFYVRAIDPAGNVDGTPAKRKFRVPKLASPGRRG
jgi:hypothetical protein